MAKRPIDGPRPSAAQRVPPEIWRQIVQHAFPSNHAGAGPGGKEQRSAWSGQETRDLLSVMKTSHMFRDLAAEFQPWSHAKFLRESQKPARKKARTQDSSQVRNAQVLTEYLATLSPAARSGMIHAFLDKPLEQSGSWQGVAPQHAVQLVARDASVYLQLPRELQSLPDVFRAFWRQAAMEDLALKTTQIWAGPAEYLGEVFSRDCPERREAIRLHPGALRLVPFEQHLDEATLRAHLVDYDRQVALPKSYVRALESMKRYPETLQLRQRIESLGVQKFVRIAEMSYVGVELQSICDVLGERTPDIVMAHVAGDSDAFDVTWMERRDPWVAHFTLVHDGWDDEYLDEELIHDREFARHAVLVNPMYLLRRPEEDKDAEALSRLAEVHGLSANFFAQYKLAKWLSVSADMLRRLLISDIDSAKDIDRLRKFDPAALRWLREEDFGSSVVAQCPRLVTREIPELRVNPMAEARALRRLSRTDLLAMSPQKLTKVGQNDVWLSQCLSQCPEIFLHAGAEVFGDPTVRAELSVVLDARSPFFFLQEAFNNRRALISLVGGAEENIRQRVQNRDDALAVVRCCGGSLRLVPEQMRADKGVVMAAFYNDPLSILYAADEIRSSEEVMLPLVRQCPAIIAFGGETLQAGDAVAAAFLEGVQGTSREFARQFRMVDELVGSGVTLAPHQRELIRRCAEAFDQDTDLALDLASHQPQVVSWFSPELRGNLPFASRLVARQPLAFLFYPANELFATRDEAAAVILAAMLTAKPDPRAKQVPVTPLMVGLLDSLETEHPELLWSSPLTFRIGPVEGQELGAKLRDIGHCLLILRREADRLDSYGCSPRQAARLLFDIDDNVGAAWLNRYAKTHWSA